MTNTDSEIDWQVGRVSGHQDKHTGTQNVWQQNTAFCKSGGEVNWFDTMSESIPGRR